MALVFDLTAATTAVWNSQKCVNKTKYFLHFSVEEFKGDEKAAAESCMMKSATIIDWCIN